MDNSQPIIVKRISRKAAGHHGGSWKIAFADFATAMMAFFLVMWLMTSATPEQLQSISGYFNDPVGFTEGGSPFAIDLGGSPTVAPERTLNERDEVPVTQIDPETIESLAESLEQAQLDLLLQELQNKIDVDPVLQRFRDQILLEITQDGLRIQIVDAENRPMFASGSPRLQPYFEEILLGLSDVISRVPKKVSISGHTDGQPFGRSGGYGNWELSTDRANAARRTLLVAGYPEQQVARVVGYADSALFDRRDPLNPINRRIDIVVLNKRAEDQLLDSTSPGVDEGQLPEIQAPAEAAAAGPIAAEGQETDDSAVQDTAPEVVPVETPDRPRSDRPLNLFESDDPLQRLREP